MKFGFTTTSFRQIRSLEKIVGIGMKAGIDCIEWGGDIHVQNVNDAKQAKALCSKANILVNSYGSYYRIGSNNTDEQKRICEIAAEMGAKSVRVWLGRADSEKTDEAAYENLLEDAKRMCAVADEYSLIICPECHGKTYNNSTDAFLKIRNDINCDNFRTYFQSRYRYKEYDLDRIERTAQFTETVHISFSELRREQFPKYDPSYIDALLKKLVSTGFDKSILIEYTCPSMHWGFASTMIKDIAKLKAKVGK